MGDLDWILASWFQPGPVPAVVCIWRWINWWKISLSLYISLSSSHPPNKYVFKEKERKARCSIASTAKTSYRLPSSSLRGWHSRPTFLNENRKQAPSMCSLMAAGGSRALDIKCLRGLLPTQSRITSRNFLFISFLCISVNSYEIIFSVLLTWPEYSSLVCTVRPAQTKSVSLLLMPMEKRVVCLQPIAG